MKITVARDAVALDSPMEALFYGLCCFHEIPVERVVLSAAGELGGSLWHWPGFRVAVPKIIDSYVEISDGSNDAALRPCRTAWRQSGRSLVVLYREELDSLREASRPAQFVARLKLLAR